MKLRSATAADIPFLMELEHACPAAGHWTESQYQQAVEAGSGDPERLVLVAEMSSPAGRASGDPGSGIVGFLVARHFAPEWELENIAVVAAARRRGIGRQLLGDLLKAASHTAGASVFLEVRESNAAARKLYEKMGFVQTGRRKSYYRDPPEDAILYTRRNP